MIDYVYDDGGRAEAGYKGKAADCVIRAIAIATGTPYAEVYGTVGQHLTAAIGSRAIRRGVPKKVRDALYRKFGLVKVMLAAGERPTLTEAHERYGDCICTTTKHSMAVVGGALRDTCDVRTYEWRDDETADIFRDSAYDEPIVRERKAMSVYYVVPG